MPTSSVCSDRSVPSAQRVRKPAGRPGRPSTIPTACSSSPTRPTTSATADSRMHPRAHPGRRGAPPHRRMARDTQNLGSGGPAAGRQMGSLRGEAGTEPGRRSGREPPGLRQDDLLRRQQKSPGRPVRRNRHGVRRVQAPRRRLRRADIRHGIPGIAGTVPDAESLRRTRRWWVRPDGPCRRRLWPRGCRPPPCRCGRSGPASTPSTSGPGR